jgi:hypothetical protein
MSFKWFIYFSALCGAWAAFIGWALGRMLAPDSPLPGAAVMGMILGLLVALALGSVDALWNLPSGQNLLRAQRVGVCLLVGCFGGLIGGVVGQYLANQTGAEQQVLKGCLDVFGWTITGMLIGLSIGAFEYLSALKGKRPTSGPRAKLLKSLAGGTLGGLAGGLLRLWLKGAGESLFHSQNTWSPSAIGFVILGLCIGLMVGLSQILFREAWIKVQSGFRAGRELLLTKEETVIGRAEGSDVPLFGDAGVERRHARIVRRGDRYVLEHLGGPSATFVNDAPVVGPTALKSGDLIRVGRSVLSFGERQKRTA